MRCSASKCWLREDHLAFVVVVVLALTRANVVDTNAGVVLDAIALWRPVFIAECALLADRVVPPVVAMVRLQRARDVR